MCMAGKLQNHAPLGRRAGVHGLMVEQEYWHAYWRFEQRRIQIGSRIAGFGCRQIVDPCQDQLRTAALSIACVLRSIRRPMPARWRIQLSWSKKYS